MHSRVGDSTKPKLNLTLEEGESITDVVRQFCILNQFSLTNVEALEKGLRARIVNPKPLELILGVIIPNGFRQILGKSLLVLSMSCESDVDIYLHALIQRHSCGVQYDS